MARKLAIIGGLAVVISATLALRVLFAEQEERDGGLLAGIAHGLRGEEQFTGRVVLAGDPEQGIADATVSSFPKDSSASFFRTKTDAEGRFADRALKRKSLVGAISKDG